MDAEIEARRVALEARIHTVAGTRQVKSEVEPTPIALHRSKREVIDLTLD